VSPRTQQFERCFKKLPQSVQRQARSVSVRYLTNPTDPNLIWSGHMGGWKLLNIFGDYYAAMISVDGDIVWVWIGHMDNLPIIL
jgi:hypothetical protein